MRTKAFDNHGGFPLRAVINLLSSSLRTVAPHSTINWPLVALIRLHSHPTACCFWFFLLSVLRTIFLCAFCAICLVAALAASQWNNLCLPSCCVLRLSVFDVAPANLPVLDPLWPGAGDCVSVMCWFGIGEEDDNERKWEALMTI